MAKDADKKKPGPEPDHLKIEGDWEDAVKKALEKKRDEWSRFSKSVDSVLRAAT